jgi:hypothetical protein
MPRRDLLHAGFLVCFLGAAAAGCARQAVVVSEPGVGTAQAEATLRADLERLAEAQNGYYGGNGRYADALSELGLTPAIGVRIDVIQGDRDGFSAIGRAGDAECAVYLGDVRSPRSYLTRPDVVQCRP